MSLQALLLDLLGDKYHDDVAKYQAEYPYADSRLMRYLVFHHTAGPRGQRVAELHAYHKHGRGWPGVGYHFVIRQGHVHQVGDLNTQRAHTYGRNRDGLGIAFVGDYEHKGPPDPADVRAAQALVAALDVFYGHEKRIAGHRQIALAGHGTACPGRHLVPVLQTLRGTVPGVDMAKVVWWLEEAQRQAEEDGLIAESEFIGTNYTADAVKRRDSL